MSGIIKDYDPLEGELWEIKHWAYKELRAAFEMTRNGANDRDKFAVGFYQRIIKKIEEKGV